jgi:hypothetical protein
VKAHEDPLAVDIGPDQNGRSDHQHALNRGRPEQRLREFRTYPKERYQDEKQRKAGKHSRHINPLYFVR